MRKGRFTQVALFLLLLEEPLQLFIYLFICSHTVLTPSPPGKILCVHDGNFDSYCVYCMGMWLSFYCLSQHTPRWQNFPRGSGSKGDSYPCTHIFPSFFLTLNSFTGRMAGGFRSMAGELAYIHGMCVKHRTKV